MVDLVRQLDPPDDAPRKRGSAARRVLGRPVWWILRHANARWAAPIRRLPLVHALSHALSPPGRRTWARVAAGPASGLWILHDPRYEPRLRLGTHEPEVQRRLSELVRPGDVVWDVGAHIGYFTLLLSRLVGPEGRVVAFEPDRENVDALGAALARNDVANVELRPVAVWSKAGELSFQAAADAGGTHGAVVDSGDPTVAATALDLEPHPPPDLLKIDVEGAEEQVLLGAQRLLAEQRPVVVCEVHVVRRGSPALLARVRALLEEVGYELEELGPGSGQPHVIAVPATRPLQPLA